MRFGMSCSDSGKLGRLAAEIELNRLCVERQAKYEQSPVLCKHCRKPLPYQKRRGSFCSHACSASFNNVGVRRHGLPPAECAHCGKPVKRRGNRFCSRQCSSSSAVRTIAASSPMIANSCLSCGRIGVKAKFCSSQCMQDFAWKDRKNRIALEGVVKNPRLAKRYLKDIRGESCSICGTKEWMGQVVPLVLDHINGQAEDNSLANLRLVCGNCDMQLPTYKSKNRGHGRFFRRQRYAAGKSY